MLGVSVLVATPFQLAQDISTPNLNKIAEAVTVRIKGQNLGSGVIIKRQDDVYTVLTADHVVTSKSKYKLVTSDELQHRLNNGPVRKIPNLNLTLFEFTSSNDYEVAQIGDSAEVKSGELIYVSGFPVPTTAITKSILTLSEGKVVANATQKKTNGHKLIYDNNTLPGMSGGAIFNREGKLIGIHGRTDTQQQEQRTEMIYINIVMSYGTPINSFFNAAADLSPNLEISDKLNELVSTKLTADDWFIQAKNKFHKYDYQGAVLDFSQALVLNPRYSSAFLYRSLSHIKLKNITQAISDLDNGITLDSDNPYAYFLRGMISIELGKYDKVISDLDHAISLAHNNLELVEIFYIYKSLFLIGTDKYSEAKDVLQELTEIQKTQNIDTIDKRIIQMINDIEKIENLKK